MHEEKCRKKQNRCTRSFLEFPFLGALSEFASGKLVIDKVLSAPPGFYAAKKVTVKLLTFEILVQPGIQLEFLCCGVSERDYRTVNGK